MNEQLEWFRQVLETAVQLYFRQECAYTSLAEIPQAADTRFWSDLLAGKGILVEPRFDEKVVLMLALVPHLCPWMLDIFFTCNQTLDRPYTEFGGRAGRGYRGFLPTGETAAFILCGDRPAQRIRLTALFDKEHWFHTADVLALTGRNEGDPFLSGLLTLSESLLLNLQTLALTGEPEDFPGVDEPGGRNCLESIDEPGLPEVPDDREAPNVSDRTERVSAPTGFFQPLPAACLAERPAVTLRTAKTQSPCFSCDAAPCCKVLHIDELTVATVTELDKIRYYLNFPYIEVLLTVDGKCSVYYSTPCRHFDTERSLCRVHNQASQTEICRNYSPYHCFYRKAEADKKHIEQGYIWLNRARFDRLEELCRFDEEHRLKGMPSPDRLVGEMNAIAYDLAPEPHLSVAARPVSGRSFAFRFFHV